MPDEARYQTHGALLPGDPLYIRRHADDELVAGVRAGEFCYVLAPRQVGKSSLRAHAVVELQREGIMVAAANMQAGGGVRSEGEWYEGVVDQLVGSAISMNPGFAMPFEWTSWWSAQLGPLAQRFVKFLKLAFLVPTEERQWLITIDEIDASISLPFTDSFFAAIRLCFDLRPEQPEYRRLSIVLLGAATPTDLIKDRSRTPFNIGTRIEMTDFSLEEARPLAALLPVGDDIKPVVLERVLFWTGGQPHLTQVVCRTLQVEWAGAAPVDAAAAIAAVDRTVEKTFFHGGILADAHFAYITKRARDFARPRQLLRTYRRARRRGISDEQRSAQIGELKIAGLVKPDAAGTLRVANPIYQRVFDDKWIRDTRPVSWPMVMAQLSAAAVMLFLLFGYFTFISRPYIEQLRNAQNDLPSDAYRKLARLPGYKATADELIAAFWDRRAEAQEAGALDETLIYRLKALASKPTDARRQAARSALMIGGRDALRLTFRHGDEVNAAVFSPDGKTVLTGSKDSTARLWRLASGEPIGKPLQHAGQLFTVAFAPDGRVVATGSDDGTARIWDAATAAPLSPPLRHEDQPDGRRTPNFAGRNGRAAVRALAFGPTGSSLATASLGGTARLWTVPDGKPIGGPLQHEDWVFAIAFSPDGDAVLTGSSDNTARLWNAHTGAPIVTFHQADEVNAVAFSRDGQLVFTGGHDRALRVWDRGSGKSIATLMNDNTVFAIAVNPNGASVLTGSWGNYGRLWSTDTWRQLGAPMEHGKDVWSVAFSPDGSLAATGSGDATARLWDARTGAIHSRPVQHRADVFSVAFSPDERTLLTGSFDGTARLWDVASMTGDIDKAIEDGLRGTPSEILDRWLMRTALQFGPDGVALVPRFSTPPGRKSDTKPGLLDLDDAAKPSATPPR